MQDWRLGVDFGTNYTVVAVHAEGVVRTVDLESDGRTRMPSSALLNVDGDIVVGAAAQRQAVFQPERYEPTPKRLIGEQSVFLGDRAVPVVDLVAAVYRRAYTETCRQEGETVPASITVTHPADWSDHRLQVLRQVLAKAGMDGAVLIAEPVAAAVAVSRRAVAVGRAVAIYDFGGGTFDAAVLRRTAEGFELVGEPVGRDPLGGEDLDRRIIDHLGALLAGDHPDAWAKLMDPPDTEWRRHAAELRTQVRQAKEALSDTGVTKLWVPGVNRDVQLTQPELRGVIKADVDATVDSLERAIALAGMAPADLAGIHLVGGSSRIPMVAEAVWNALGVRPLTHDNPKAVVALGAVLSAVREITDPAPSPPTRPTPPDGPDPGATAAVTPVATSPPPTAAPPHQATPARRPTATPVPSAVGEPTVRPSSPAPGPTASHTDAAPTPKATDRRAGRRRRRRRSVVIAVIAIAVIGGVIGGLVGLSGSPDSDQAAWSGVHACTALPASRIDTVIGAGAPTVTYMAPTQCVWNMSGGHTLSLSLYSAANGADRYSEISQGTGFSGGQTIAGVGTKAYFAYQTSGLAGSSLESDPTLVIELNGRALELDMEVLGGSQSPSYQSELVTLAETVIGAAP